METVEDGYSNFSYFADNSVHEDDYWSIKANIDSGWPTALEITSELHWRAIKGYYYDPYVPCYLIICTNSETHDDFEYLDFQNLGLFLFTCAIRDVLPGNANGDGVVNVFDITKVVRIILEMDPPTPGADANLDGAINVFDITKIVRIILLLDESSKGASKPAVLTTVPVIIDAPAQVQAGSSFTATVNIGQVTDLNSAQFDISFNNSVLQLTSVTAGQIGTTSVSVASRQLSPGNYRIISSLGLGSVSGTGTLAVLHFQVVGTPGQSSNISISNGLFSNMSAEQIPATWTGDSVLVY